MYILDYPNKRTYQLSNDAFFYMYIGEMPLDDDNLEEAEEIMQQFPEGFEVENNWEYMDEGMVQATFIPYITRVERPYDLRWEASKIREYRITYIDEETISLYTYNPQTGETKDYGEFKLQVNKYGKTYFTIPSNTPGIVDSELFIGGFTK